MVTLRPRAVSSSRSIGWLGPCALLLMGALVGTGIACGPAKEKPVPGARRIVIHASAAEFSPARVDARPGERLNLVFKREGPSCVTSVEFPDLGTTHELPDGEPVQVVVSAPQSGSLTFRCPMDMARGEIRVQ